MMASMAVSFGRATARGRELCGLRTFVAGREGPDHVAMISGVADVMLAQQTIQGPFVDDRSNERIPITETIDAFA